MIIGFVKNQNLSLSQPMIVSNSLDYLEMKFVFQSSDWSGLSKWAHFKQGSNIYDVLITGDMIHRADHLNLGEGEWEVYLHGNGADEIPRITTDVEKLVVKPTGFVCNPLPEIPLSAAEQIAAQSQRAEDKAEQAIQTAIDSKLFAERAEQAAKNAEVSENNASLSATGALNSAIRAKRSEENALLYAGKTADDAKSANESKVASAESEKNAKVSETNASKFEASSKSYMESAKEFSETATTQATNAKNSADKASTSELNAGESANKAHDSEINAKASEGNAKTSETNAGNSENNAKKYADNAKLSETSAGTSAQNASTSEQNASGSATTATNEANRAKNEADRAKTAADSIVVDTELSETSTNPVENQAVTKALEGKADKEGKWELIEIVEFKEDARIKRDKEPDGTPYDFQSLQIKLFVERT